MILPIQTGTDNPILRTKSLPVASFDKKLKTLAADMIDTMLDEKNPGVGLAAPQIGHSIRLVIVDLTSDDETADPRPVVMINPVIVAKSEKRIESDEGCLSLPKEFDKVLRHATVTVAFQDIKGKPMQLALSGLPARCIQHEIDHLDGILFVDRAEKKTKKGTTL